MQIPVNIQTDQHQQCQLDKCKCPIRHQRCLLGQILPISHHSQEGGCHKQRESSDTDQGIDQQKCIGQIQIPLMHMRDKIGGQHSEEHYQQDHKLLRYPNLLIGHIAHDQHKYSQDQKHACLHILIQEEIISNNLVNIREFDR